MFQTSKPVTSSDFQNRAAHLARFDSAIDALRNGAPRWMALIGQRKVGKTSLLFEVARRQASPSMRFVIFDVLEHQPLNLSFLRRYALRCIDAALSFSTGVSVERASTDPLAFRRALEESPQWLALPPQLRAELIGLPEFPLGAELVHWALELPERLAQALRTYFFVAIDEFQELTQFHAGRKAIDILSMARSVWQRHERVSYVISGSARTMLRELVSSPASPFFQHFTVVEMGVFDIEDACALLQSAAPVGLAISDDVAYNAVQHLGCHPFYIQLFGQELVDRGLPVDHEALKEAFQTLYFSRTGRLALFFENQWQRIVGRSTAQAAALAELARGPRRLMEVARAIGAASGATVRTIERLGDVVVRLSDGSYMVDDPVFAAWVRWRQPGGSVVPMTLLGDEAEQATANAMALMGFDLVYTSRGSRGAFDLLATRGPIQVGVQVKRSKLPLRFSKSAWQRMLADGQRLGWAWTVVCVEPDHGEPRFLDPGRARVGREVRLTDEAVISNVLAWVDEQPR